MDRVKLNMKSWAILLSHMNGFAAISAWGAVQQAWLASSPGLSLLVLPLALAGTVLLHTLTTCVRRRITAADDHVDALEKAWEAEVVDAENDIAGLALSFLWVQSLRFAIG